MLYGDAVDWWRDGVIYQVYPRSFADSDGDGVGDLKGITSRLDHLAWLGVDAVWSSPITVSPNADWGYDVADYCDVDPSFGTLDDLDELVAEATARGIKVILDIVPNHSSAEHPWFVDARSSRDAVHRDWYVWADGDPPGRADASPPNNWQSAFGGPAWTFDEHTGQWYLHHFVPEQPDLNWWNDGVVAEFDRILRFWFDRGIAGFRIDVAHMIVKDRELRDNPPGDAWADTDLVFFDMDRPELHDVLKHWRTIAEEYDPPRLLLGETYLSGVKRLAGFYGDGDELQLAFNFPFFRAPFQAEVLRELVDEIEVGLPADAWPVWTASNHDHSRLPTRWAQNDAKRTRLAVILLLTLRGTPVLYYGDELGMADTPVTRTQVMDPVGRRYWPVDPGRDIARTPMLWDDGPGRGFTTAPAAWLPFGDAQATNVADERDDPSSVLHLCRRLLALRKAQADLRRGAYEVVAAPDGVWLYRRGDSIVVALNLSAAPQVVELPAAEVLLGTARVEGTTLDGGPTELAPWEGVVLGVAAAPRSG